MSESERSSTDPAQAWKDHVFSAAKSFLKCAVAIDDRPFGNTGGTNALSGVGQTKDAVTGEARDYAGLGGPLPTTPKTAVAKRAGTKPKGMQIESGTRPSEGTHKLDLKVLTDAFAEEGIICGTLVPDIVRDVEGDLIARALNMAQTADILIIDWYLKSRDPEPTLKIIESVLRVDKKEGGRTRLICIYTGEDQLDSIRDQVGDRLKEQHCLKPNQNDCSVTLRNGSTSIVFINKKNINGWNKLERGHSASEKELPKRLINEFTHLIDGLLPSFAASSVGAVRRNTHGILDIFRPEIDAAYVGNRAICDPSEGVAELMRELLVSELDNQIGYARCADDYLSKNAISLWLGTPGRVQAGCKVSLTKQRNGRSLGERKNIEISVDLIRRLACGDVVSLEKPIPIDGEKFKINEKERLKFTQALCRPANSANRIEETFARLASNKREAFGRETAEQDWRPSLTLGTILVTSDPVEFYMCVTRACDMVRLSGQTKKVVLLSLIQIERGFNLVIRDSMTTNVKLRVPREFAEMKIVEFKVEKSTRRVTASPRPCENGRCFRFEAKSSDIEYRYLGELRYLRALRDVSEIVKKSTAIGIADSEWLRLNDRI